MNYLYSSFKSSNDIEPYYLIRLLYKEQSDSRFEIQYVLGFQDKKDLDTVVKWWLDKGSQYAVTFDYAFFNPDIEELKRQEEAREMEAFTNAAKNTNKTEDVTLL